MFGLFGYDFLGLQPNTLEYKSFSNSKAQWENMTAFIDLYNRYANLAITRYIWDGLPDSVSERFLNMALFFYGSAAFFFDPEMGYMALPCTSAGEYNAYYEPTRVNAFSFNYNRMLQRGEFVYIRNNPSATPTAMFVFEYTRRIADVLRTIDVLTKRMKHPYAFMCDEKERLTINNIIKQIQDNEIMVLGSKSYDLGQRTMDIKPLTVPNVLNDLWDSYYSLQNILCTGLGIESVGFEKSERLITDEVNANNMFTAMSIETNIKELQAACDKINRMFNLNISVKAKDLYDYRREEDGSGGEVYD